MNAVREWRRPNGAPFIVLALASLPFIIVFLDRWDLQQGTFALLVTFATFLTLTVELGAMAFLRTRTLPLDARARWFIQYGLSSATGSLTLITAFAITGLAQDRAPYVLGIVVIARVLNTYVLAFMIDKITAYRSEARRIRDELAPTLRSVEATNALLDEIETAEVGHEIDVITRRVELPLKQLAAGLAGQDNDTAAASIEGFIDQTLRPLSHRMHPTSVATGITSAAGALGIHLVLDDSAAALEASNTLLDQAVLWELHRWLTETSDRNPQLVGDLEIRAHVHERWLQLDMAVGNPAPLDARHAVAGIRAKGASSVQLPLRGQFVDPVVSGVDVPAADEVPEQGQRARTPRIWTGDQGPGPYLVAALTLVAAPSITFISNADVTAAIALAALVSIALPVILSVALARIRVCGPGWWPPTWIIVSWLGVGAMSGFGAAASLDAFSSGIDPGQWFAELTRAIVRLSIPGIAISFFGEFAAQARNLAQRVQKETDDALESRRQILHREHERSRLIAEVLHRRVQSRLTAIALLLHLDRRAEAITELNHVVNALVPNLIKELSREIPETEISNQSGDQSIGFTVTHVDSPELELLFAHHGDTTRTVIDECATNALRHGSATRMDVSAELQKGEIVLYCVDDGIGPQSMHRHRGLGSRIFDDEVGADFWSLRRDNNRTIAEFRFPWQHGTDSASSPTHFEDDYIPR